MSDALKRVTERLIDTLTSTGTDPAGNPSEYCEACELVYHPDRPGHDPNCPVREARVILANLEGLK